MGALYGTQYLSDSVDHVLQLYALLLDLVLDPLEVVYQSLQQHLLLFKELLLALDLLMLLLREVQRVTQLHEPLISLVVGIIVAEQMFALCRRPHHVPMQCGQTQVHNLSEVFIDCVDALFAGGTDAVAQAVDDRVDLLCRVFPIVGPFQEALQLLDHLMPTGCKAAHLYRSVGTVLFWLTTRWR